MNKNSVAYYIYYTHIHVCIRMFIVYHIYDIYTYTCTHTCHIYIVYTKEKQ